MKLRKSFTIVVAVLLALAAAVAAEVPSMISYQGRLTDAVGDPVANGGYDITFTIYDALSDGNSIWTETQSVIVSDGLFSLCLGAENPIEDSVFKESTRFLGVQLGTNSEMTPRVALIAVPYANRVATIDGAAGGDVSGNVRVIGSIHANGSISSGGSITLDGIVNTITSTSGSISFDNENISTTGVVGMGGFQMTNGSATGLVLTSDGAGNGTWQNPSPVPTSYATTFWYNGTVDGLLDFFTPPPGDTLYVTNISCYPYPDGGGGSVSFRVDAADFLVLGISNPSWSAGGGAPLTVLPGQTFYGSTGTSENKFIVTVTGFRY